jgi:hypothetical protein
MKRFGGSPDTRLRCVVFGKTDATVKPVWPEEMIREIAGIRAMGAGHLAQDAPVKKIL